MTDDKFYVYQYLNEDKIPYYIGKESNNRINESHSPWIELPPKDRRQIIVNGLTEKEAFDLEIKLIKQYGRKIDGGILDNIKISRWVAQSGWQHSEKTKKRISEKNKGKTYSPEMIKKYQAPKSKKHAENIKNAVKALWADPEYRKKRLEKIKEKPFAHKGKPWSSARREAYMKKQNNKGSAI